jgi:hypothetical protein
MERIRRLQLVPVSYAAPMGAFQEEKVQWLQGEDDAGASARLQGLALSFAAGGLVLVAGRFGFGAMRERSSTRFAPIVASEASMGTSLSPGISSDVEGALSSSSE